MRQVPRISLPLTVYYNFLTLTVSLALILTVILTLIHMLSLALALYS